MNLTNALTKFLQELPAGPVWQRNWELGRWLHHAEAISAAPAAFWAQVQPALAGTPLQGQGPLLLRFYQSFDLPSLQASSLYWGHYAQLLRLPVAERRDYLWRCAEARQWTVGQLARQINTSWDLRRPLSPAAPAAGPAGLSWLPNPVVLDFVPAAAGRQEKTLEQALVDQLGVLLLELGQELAFVGRQFRQRDGRGRLQVIDLVFYHYRQRHFVLLELKRGRLTPQDLGQVEAYRRRFDALWPGPQDGPTHAVVLARSLDEALPTSNPLVAAVPYTLGVGRRSSAEASPRRGANRRAAGPAKKK